MTVAVDPTERRKFAPPKTFVEIFGGCCADLPGVKTPGLSMPRYTKLLVRMGSTAGCTWHFGRPKRMAVRCSTRPRSAFREHTGGGSKGAPRPLPLIRA